MVRFGSILEYKNAVWVCLIDSVMTVTNDLNATLTLSYPP